MSFPKSFLKGFTHFWTSLGPFFWGHNDLRQPRLGLAKGILVRLDEFGEPEVDGDSDLSGFSVSFNGDSKRNR